MQPHYDITQNTLNHMASEPPPDAVRQICEITGLSPSSAAILLKKHNNNVERGIDAYFADPEDALREQPNSHTWEPQDNVPFADDSSTGAMPATRPPSRADNKIVDLSHVHAQANAAADNDDEMNDPEMQRAINLSLGKPEMPEQENGVTGAGQQFGPATRQTYDPSQWSMVPVATSRELVDHPPPIKRRRIEGRPAFLRPSQETGYLAALLTIYHSIPLAREALLMPPMKVLAYGHDPAWWSGSSDENRKSLSMETDANADKNKINLLAEVQCLMAFLDGTTRAYGGVDALADLNALRNFRYMSSTQFSSFLEAWKDSALAQPTQEPYAQIFSSTAIKNAEPDAPLTRDMVCVEAQVNRVPGQLLLTLLDSTVWDDTLEQLEDVWISRAAEVFTIRLYDPGQQPEGLDLTAPAIWYPDRYTWALREQTRRMRQEIQEIGKHVNQLVIQQRRLASFMGHDRRPVRALEVLEAAAKASKTALEDRYGEHRPSEELDGLDVTSIEQHVQAVLRRVEDKIKTLEERKVVLVDRIRDISMQYTEPGDDPDDPPFMKYVLQGVATKPEIMYIRERNQDLLGLDDEEDGERQEYQWWRIQWTHARGQDQTAMRPPIIGPVTQAQAEGFNGISTPTDDVPYSVTPVSEDDVIEAARTEHHSVVLVYASENAMNFENKPLSPALKQFVEQDNGHFANELRELADELDEPGVPWEDVSLNDSAPVRPDREATPMSTSTHRGEDGQPSPKRPRSSDDSRKSQDEGLPSYDEAIGSPLPEMQEKSHKIGLYAERMLERYGNGNGNGDGKAAGEQEAGETIHVERATDLPR